MSSMSSDLCKAIIEGRTEDVSNFLYSNADLDISKHHPEIGGPLGAANIIFAAAKYGRTDILHLLKKIYDDKPNGHKDFVRDLFAGEESRHDAFYIATKKCHAETLNAMLKMLIEPEHLQTAIRRTDSEGCDLLNMCYKDKHLEVARVLVGFGAEIYSNRNGMNALHLSVTHGSSIMVRFYAEHFPMFPRYATNSDKGGSAIHLAIIHEQFDIIRLLIQLDPSLIDQPSSMRKSPLGYAARNSRSDLVLLLLELGSKSINAVDILGWTPLHHAISVNAHLTVKILLDHGADHTIQSINGSTPVHIACMNDHKYSLRVLATKPWSSLHIPNSDGELPIHIAAMRGNSKVLKEILRLNTPIDTLNRYGKTPLDQAILLSLHNKYRNKCIHMLRCVGPSIFHCLVFRMDGLDLDPISEEEILEVRLKIYFKRSLTWRLLMHLNRTHF